MKKRYLFLNPKNYSSNNIIKMSNFISKYQADENSLVGNFAISIEEIQIQLKEYLRQQKHSFFQFVKDNSGEIRGFLGSFFSDPNTVRLVGPFVTNIEQEREEISERLFEKILEKYKSLKNIKLRVAFTRKNIFLKGFFEIHEFKQYNAERTMELKLHEWQPKRYELIYTDFSKVEIRDYLKSDFNTIQKIHPLGAYFSADDMVKNLNDQRHLTIAVLNAKVVGYVYYEDFKADGFTDICFVNVMPAARNIRIGTILLHHAIEDSFKIKKIRKIIISVSIDNRAAFRLYKRLGFKETTIFLAYELKLF